jgi:hypothetical protein
VGDLIEGKNPEAKSILMTTERDEPDEKRYSYKFSEKYVRKKVFIKH